jgi:hypothetical protein
LRSAALTSDGVGTWNGPVAITTFLAAIVPVAVSIRRPGASDLCRSDVAAVPARTGARMKAA